MNVSTPSATGASLTALAGRTELVDAIVQSGDTQWAVLLSDDRSLQIEWLDEPPRLLLTAMLGTPPAERETEVLRAAMSYNAMWSETGGVRLAQAGEGGELMLIQEVHPASVDEATEQATLDNFAALQAWWSFYCTSEQRGYAPSFDLQTITMRI